MQRTALTLLSIILLAFTHALANDTGKLLLRFGERSHSIDVDELRRTAADTFEFRDPFQERRVLMRGIPLAAFLREHAPWRLGAIELQAWDGYEHRMTRNEWDHPSWILVTHEDGRPLGLRQHGPLRLVYRDYDPEDATNLRNLSSWVWMIAEIRGFQPE